MDLEKIEDFLINYCGYSSIEEAKKSYKPMNLYPLIGELPDLNKIGDLT